MKLPLIVLAATLAAAGTAQAQDAKALLQKHACTACHAEDKKVVPTCIHCHQLGEAERRFYRDAGRPIPERLLFPYPNPKALGLVIPPAILASADDVIE